MIVYLDSSVLVSLLTIDPCTERASSFFKDQQPSPIVSDFAAAEFVSAISRRVRTGELPQHRARSVLTDLDQWIAKSATRVLTESADIASADGMLRRLDLTLRTPDAINIAVCLRAGAVLATFDEKMTACALALGVTVTPT